MHIKQSISNLLELPSSPWYIYHFGLSVPFSKKKWDLLGKELERWIP